MRDMIAIDRAGMRFVEKLKIIPLTKGAAEVSNDA